jgi:hypothetical protein
MISTVINNMGPGLVRERFNVTYKDFTAAALTQLINLKPVPKGSVIFAVVAKPRTSFSGGGIGSCTLKVGLAAGVADTLMAAGDIAAAVADTTQYTSNAKGTPLVATNAADTITATITTTTQNGNLMTAGSVDIDVFYWLTEDLTATGPVGNSLATGGY